MDLDLNYIIFLAYVEVRLWSTLYILYIGIYGE